MGDPNCAHEFVVRKDYGEKPSMENGCIHVFPDGYTTVAPAKCRKCNMGSHEVVGNAFQGVTWIGNDNTEYK